MAEQAVYNLTVRQGSTFEQPLQFKAAGAAMDLRGYTIRGEIRGRVVDALVLAFRVIATDLSTGKVTLIIVAEDSEQLPVGTHAYDVELVDPSGRVTSPIGGAFVVARGVTR